MLNLAEVCAIKERNKTFMNNYFGNCNILGISDIMIFYNNDINSFLVVSIQIFQYYWKFVSQI